MHHTGLFMRLSISNSCHHLINSRFGIKFQSIIAIRIIIIIDAMWQGHNIFNLLFL